MGKSIKEQLQAAKRPEHVVTVCLRGDLVAQIEDLDNQLHRTREEEQAASAPGKRMGGKSQSLQIAEQIEKLRTEMAESEVSFRLRALSKDRWRELKHEHEAGEDATGVNQRLGVDIDTLTPALLPMVTVDPEMDADDWRQLEQVVSGGDWQRLGVAAVMLHEMGVDIPKSALASLVRQKRDADSK